MCTLKVKQGKTLTTRAGSSGQSISNDGDKEDNENDNNNDDHYQELDADDSVS